MRVDPENNRTFFKVILLKQLTRISFWAFALILAFSHQGRRIYEFFCSFFPRPFVGEGQGEGATHLHPHLELPRAMDLYLKTFSTYKEKGVICLCY
jgi:hypothetical protein